MRPFLTIDGVSKPNRLRVATRGRGKKGGARLIYYFRQSIGRIYLILVYGKSRKDNITAAELSAMKMLVAKLEEEK